MTVAETLRAATARLAARSDSARLDAELLIAHVLRRSRAGLLAHDRDPIAPAQHEAIATLVERRARGEPVAYLLGTQGFWTLDLAVTPATLIPRPETETLVAWGLELLNAARRVAAPAAAPADMPSHHDGSQGHSAEPDSRFPGNDRAQGSAPRILDLGTGSGCIALALARERPDAHVTATDRCARALDVARRNAAHAAHATGASTPVFLEGRWFDALQARDAPFDLILSNPPYIAEHDPHLEALAFEPRGALVSGADGLDDLRRIVADAPRWLRAGGWLLVEHGHEQGAAVRALFARAGFARIDTRRDLGGRERVTGGMRT